MNIPEQARWSGMALLLAIAVGACGSTQRAEQTQASQANKTEAKTWTLEFQASSTLVAREVSIEGPPGLREHVAFQQIPGQHYTAKATNEGFLQEITVDNNEGELIRVQLDNLAIAAEQRIRVLERVGDGPVRVRAVGDVFWKNLATGEERRTETLELNGLRPQ
jgi:hypothetical protein